MLLVLICKMLCIKTLLYFVSLSCFHVVTANLRPYFMTYRRPLRHRNCSLISHLFIPTSFIPNLKPTTSTVTYLQCLVSTIISQNNISRVSFVPYKYFCPFSHRNVFLCQVPDGSESRRNENQMQELRIHMRLHTTAT